MNRAQHNCKFTNGPRQGTNHPGVQLQTQRVGDGIIHSPARDDVTNQLALASRWSSRSLGPSLPLFSILQSPAPALSFLRVRFPPLHAIALQRWARGARARARA